MTSRFFQDITDASKRVDFNASGLPAATTRVITMPNANVRLIPNGVSLPTSAAMIGELFQLDGVGLHESLDLVGNWMKYTGAISTGSINDNAVTNAKLADMPANAVKVNATGATADPTDLVIGASTLLGRGATGDLGAMTSAQARLILRRAANTLTFNAAQAWDLNNGLFQRLTATGNFTLGFPANAAEGETAFLYVTQDGTGNRLITWNASYRFPGGTPITLSTAAGAVDRIEFFFHTDTLATVTATKGIS